MPGFVRSACTHGYSLMLSGKRGERDADERAIGVLELHRH